jgi:tartrate-resistant acid phosphatase type 5
MLIYFMLNRIYILVILSILSLNLFAQKQSISFIAIGDWGRGGKYNQKETAEQMGLYAGKKQTDFIITTGDNIYNTGVINIDDPKFKTSFEDIYTASSLNIPWYITLGNHDYGGSVQAQIDYSNVSTRWKLPSRYYSFEKKLDDGTTVLFIITDTNPFIQSYKTPDKGNDELSESSVSELSRMTGDDQLKWMDSLLSSTKAKWKIVSGHHPLISGGEHGNTPELIEKFKPLFVKYNVTMYMCGHDHDLQYLKEKENNVHYFVTGAGSKLRTTKYTENSLFAESINGFFGVEVKSDVIKCEFVDYLGNILYTTEIK